MKTLSILMIVFALFTFNVNGQYKKDGTPDMRYNANKQTYGNSYSSPSPSSGTNPSIRHQESYTKDNGTNVQSHYKTNTNTTNHDNFSTDGNTNPYTGEKGSKAKDYSPDASNYGSGKTIQTGEKGGQYYINNNGNKTYVPKR